jgi:Killing trait
MAFPTEVNSQITDAVTQSNVEVLCSAPAQALSALYGALAHSLALAAANAVTAQQNTNVIMQAVTTRSVSTLLGSNGKLLPAAASSHE